MSAVVVPIERAMRQASDDVILWDVIEEHLDEAAFLLELWESALDSADYSLDEVRTGLEARLWAHLDGLILHGPRVAERVLRPRLENPNLEDWTQTTAAALVRKHF